MSSIIVGSCSSGHPIHSANWRHTEADHWVFVEQVAHWKRTPLSPAQREVVERLEGQVTALGELLNAIIALAKELRAGTIDRVMEKSDIELGLE